MKRLISALLCIVMLAGLFGCKPPTQPPVDPTPPQTGSPSPEQPTKEPGPVPTTSPTPTGSPTVPSEEEPELVYSNKEPDVEIYTLEKGARTIVRYGKLSQEIADFPYNGLRPEPEVWEHDGDNDGKKELYIVHVWGSGTGVSVSRLLVCEPNGDKLDYWIHDWQPIADDFNADRAASYNKETGMVTVSWGGRTLSVPADPVEQCSNPASIGGEQVSYGRDTGNSIRLRFLLSMTSEDHPMSDFYGINLNLTLKFDGNRIAEVSDPWLSYAETFMSAWKMSPKETVTLYKAYDNGLILQCGNVGGPISYPDDLEYPPFHKDNLDKIALYEPERNKEHPVVLVSAPNAAGEEIFYELRWVQETGSWNLSHFRAIESSAANRLAFFNHTLRNGALENWYLAAMGSIYDTPAEMDLGLVFYNGFSGNEITPEEKAHLLAQGFSEHIAMHKLPAEKLDEVLNTYFGISLYDVTIPADWVYYPETDSYYSSHGDTYLVHGFDVLQVNVTDDGLIELHYYVEPYRSAFDPVTGWPVIYGILTLRANGDSLISPEDYTVVSNRSAQPFATLEEDGVSLYALPDGRLFLQDGHRAGPVSYVNDCNAKQPGYYELSKITITRKELLHDWEGEPLYDVILLNLPTADGSHNIELWWVEETSTWEQAPFRSPGPLGSLPGDLVSSDTIPSDPKEFYKVAELPDEHLWLYARNYGQDSLLVWEGNFWWYLEDRIAHSTQFCLPEMIALGNLKYAVISEVQTGTQTGVDELVVYDIDLDVESDDGHYIGMRDYVYDWRPIAEDFNRNNTIVYDKDTNSLVLYWNDEVHFTGTLPEDQSVYLGLEDGFTGALIASGQIVRYEANSDGSFTVTMQTCIGKGGDGFFSEDLSDPFWHWNGEANYYYGMSAGVTGFELSWTVNFTGEGFEASDVTVVRTGGETIHLRAALPSEEIYLFRSVGVDGKDYLLADQQITILEANQGFGDLIADFRLCDLDGDGEDEIAVVGNLYAGSGYTSKLTVLDKTADGWTVCDFFRDDADYELLETAVFSTAGDRNHVILSLDGFQFMFEVSDEVAARDGAYFASSAHLSAAITWDGEGYILHLPGQIYRNDSSIEGFYPSACDIYFELRCELEYDGSGTITQTPIGITPPYTHFTVTQREENTFELVSEQGVVRFEGTHLPGEEIVTDRRDLDLDGAEEFIVLLTSDRSGTSVHQDAYIFDGRTLEQVDTSDLWTIGRSLFVFIGDNEMFHIHCGSFRQPLYKKDILARYPDIEFLDKVEFWGNRSSLSVMFDSIEVSYDCIVGEGGESFGSLRVCLMVEDGQLVPFQIVYSSDSLYKTYQLAPSPIPGPFIGE